MRPSLKKTRKGSEAEVSAQMPEIISPGNEEQEEEEEEDAVLAFRSRGLRSRGPAVLAEAEPAGQSTVAEGTVIAEQPE